ncbi:F-box protein [Quillaja saponaria]|uniref:F-box protein n=1 Tax=Quillaja saponaria TaxID=32244 RepID=A0AAD7M3H1_QUISA|nr:F-box protein [Quillaja saponaria]
MASPCWSDLPEDLLRLIFIQPTIRSIDVLSCRDVCLSWRHVVKRLCGERFAELLPPMLFFPIKTGTNSFNVYTSTATGFYRLCLPMTQGGFFTMYSSRGWLLSSTNNKVAHRFYLYNPLSQKLICLQFPKPQEDFKLPCRFILSTTPVDPSCIIILFDNSKSRFAYYRSGHGNGGLCRFKHKIAFEDLIYYRGKFLAVQGSGALGCFVFDTNPCVKKISRSANSSVKNIATSRYLVESVSGDLLMVTRHVKCGKNISTGDIGYYKTTMFEVYSFDWVEKDWREVKELGNQALFLAHNDSRSVSAIDQAVCKRNCIYFVDDALEGHCMSKGTDFGVFDMEIGTVQQFYSVPFNRWFRPDA